MGRFFFAGIGPANVSMRVGKVDAILFFLSTPRRQE